MAPVQTPREALGGGEIDAVTMVNTSLVDMDDLGCTEFLCKNCTLWLFNIAMENGPVIDDFPIELSIYRGFSMAM